MVPRFPDARMKPQRRSVRRCLPGPTGIRLIRSRRLIRRRCLPQQRWWHLHPSLSPPCRQHPGPRPPSRQPRPRLPVQRTSVHATRITTSTAMATAYTGRSKPPQHPPVPPPSARTEATASANTGKAPARATTASRNGCNAFSTGTAARSSPWPAPAICRLQRHRVACVGRWPVGDQTYPPRSPSCRHRSNRAV